MVDLPRQTLPTAARAESGGSADVELRRDLLSRVAEQVGEGVAVFGLDDRIVYANAALADLHGCPREELIGQHLSVFIDATPEMLDRGAPPGGDGDVLRAEMLSRRPDGGRLHVKVTVSPLVDDSGVLTGWIVCVRDISAQKELEARLQRAALHDPLTDLPNRRLFTDRLEHALARAARAGTAVALLFIDLDGFKGVNDLHGHAAGDQLLVEAARRFRMCIREADTLARLGGDEFVLLVEDVDGMAQPIGTGERLLDALDTPFRIGEAVVRVSASIGVAMSSPEAPRSLLHAADSAMYQAKQAGGGRIVVRHRESSPPPRDGR